MRVGDYILLAIAVILAGYCFMGFEAVMVLGLMVVIAMQFIIMFGASYTVSPEEEEGDE